jgi:hypothetical protein
MYSITTSSWLRLHSFRKGLPYMGKEIMSNQNHGKVADERFADPDYLL